MQDYKQAKGWNGRTRCVENRKGYDRIVAPRPGNLPRPPCLELNNEGNNICADEDDAGILSKTSHDSSFERVGNWQQFLQLNHPALYPSFNSLCIIRLPRAQVKVETP